MCLLNLVDDIKLSKWLCQFIMSSMEYEDFHFSTSSVPSLRIAHIHKFICDLFITYAYIMSLYIHIDKNDVWIYYAFVISNIWSCVLQTLYNVENLRNSQ